MLEKNVRIFFEQNLDFGELFSSQLVWCGQQFYLATKPWIFHSEKITQFNLMVYRERVDFLDEKIVVWIIDGFFRNQELLIQLIFLSFFNSILNCNHYEKILTLPVAS